LSFRRLVRSPVGDEISIEGVAPLNSPSPFMGERAISLLKELGIQVRLWCYKLFRPSHLRDLEPAEIDCSQKFGLIVMTAAQVSMPSQRFCKRRFSFSAC